MQHVRRCRLTFLLILLASPFLAGCSGKGKPKIYPVAGRVMHGEQPVAGARVTFHSLPGHAAPNIDRYPTGRTDKDGYFRLTTNEEGDGAPAGNYKVLVVWPLVPGRSDGSGEGEEGDKLEGRYASPESSSIEAEVKPSANTLSPFVVQ